MKKIRLLLVIVLASLSIGSATAQRHSRSKPTVYMISYEQIDTISCPVQQAAAQRSMAAQYAREDFEATRREGFQQLHNPQVVFSTKNNRFSLGIGGEINFRTSYDVKGAVDNIDFIP